MYFYYGLFPQVGFTIFFNLEVIFKMWCLGLRGYWRLSIHKFELLLAIGTTLRLCSDLFMTPLTYFQVLLILCVILSCVNQDLGKFVVIMSYDGVVCVPAMYFVFHCPITISKIYSVFAYFILCNVSKLY